jgi:hypothetical protein
VVDEPNNIVLVMLREIRAKQDEHSGRFDGIEDRIRNMEKYLEQLPRRVTYSLGQSTDTQL